MRTSTMRICVFLASAVLLGGLARTVSAQDRAPATRDDAVVVVDGVVREVFQSARRDRLDFLVQIEVKRSESLRAAPARVAMPAPGDQIYVHTSQRSGAALGLGQVGRGEPASETRRAVPAERSQVRAYLVPDSRGAWSGAGPDWFALASNDLAAAGPSDPPPASTGPAGSPRSAPEGAPASTRMGRSALATLGLSGDGRIVQNRYVLRVASVEPGGAAGRAGIEPGDVLFGANDKSLEGPEQLEQLARAGGPLSLMVLDVNSGKTAKVRVELAASNASRPTNDLPARPGAPGAQPAPGADRRPASPPATRSLGMSAEPVQIGQRTGMKVMRVQPNSPAQQAGIEPGDVIVGANGVPITGAESLSAALHKSGARLTLTVRDTRNGKDTPVEVNLGSPDASGDVAPLPADPSLPTGIGRRLGAVTEMVFHDVDPAAKVTEVERGGPAAAAGIEPGDIIVEANGTPVLHPKALDDIVRQSGPVLKLIVIDPRTGTKTPVDVQLGGSGR